MHFFFIVLLHTDLPCLVNQAKQYLFLTYTEPPAGGDVVHPNMVIISVTGSGEKYFQHICKYCRLGIKDDCIKA